jgi:pimeloyl-ACP methyl ester carboxylesterase
LILVGTGPRGGEGMSPMTEEAAKSFRATYDPPEEIWLAVHFSPSASSQAAGREFLKRKHLRIQNRDSEVNDRVGPAQIAALSRYSLGHEGKYEYLKQIKQATLVVNGQNDVIVPTANSFHLQQASTAARLPFPSLLPGEGSAA